MQASSGEDRLVHIWDLDQKRSLDTGPEAKRARVQLPPELMLTHAGHRAPVRPICPAFRTSSRHWPPTSDLLRAAHIERLVAFSTRRCPAKGLESVHPEHRVAGSSSPPCPAEYQAQAYVLEQLQRRRC